MARPTKLFALCSLLMAFLFAYSTSVQLNDPDWYFWFPLYACASVVNLISNIYTSKTIRRMAKLAFWLGIFLFTKVAIEGYVHGLAGFWSLDLGERVVREKVGSGLVVISMFLQLAASSIPNNKVEEMKVQIAKYIEYGMATLVGVSYGLPLVFLVILKEDLKL